MKTILVVQNMTEEQRGNIRKIAAECREPSELLFSCEKPFTQEEIARADAVIGRTSLEMLQQMPNLEWYQLPSAGADADVKKGGYPENCIVTNAAGAYDLSVSEHMVALTFAMTRRLGEYMIRQQDHEWLAGGNVISIAESRVMILGAGRIGTAYAKKIKALGGYTVGVKRTPAEPGKDYPGYDEMHGLEELDSLLPAVDVVAMVLPGGDATTHIMDERRLRLMKKGAYILNVGRGSAIDPEALYKMLTEDWLGGAALDVTEPEPLPAESPLWDLKNMIITPHAAGNFWLASTFERLLVICGKNLRSYLNGEPMIHVVDKELGY